MALPQCAGDATSLAEFLALTPLSLVEGEQGTIRGCCAHCVSWHQYVAKDNAERDAILLALGLHYIGRVAKPERIEFVDQRAYRAMRRIALIQVNGKAIASVNGVTAIATSKPRFKRKAKK